MKQNQREQSESPLSTKKPVIGLSYERKFFKQNISNDSIDDEPLMP